jgi:hypothetical protein
MKKRPYSTGTHTLLPLLPTLGSGTKKSNTLLLLLLKDALSVKLIQELKVYGKKWPHILLTLERDGDLT